MDSSVKSTRSQTKQALKAKTSTKADGRRSFTGLHLLIAALAAAIVTTVLIGGLLLLSSRVDSDRYQAVFLTNGQVYFGKLHGFEFGRPRMTDVYYFPSTEIDSNQPEAEQTLIKLGSEVHRPDNEIILNREAILFVENLLNESSIVQAIERG